MMRNYPIYVTKNNILNIQKECIHGIPLCNTIFYTTTFLFQKLIHSANFFISIITILLENVNVFMLYRHFALLLLD